MRLDRCIEYPLNAQRADSSILVQADLLDSAAIPTIVATTIAVVRPARRAGQQCIFVLSQHRSGSIDLEHWDDLMGTNLKAPLFLSQSAAPHCARSARPHSQHDRHSRPASAARASRVQHSESRPRDAQSLDGPRAWGPEIRVNGIAPGPILWPGRRHRRIAETGESCRNAAQLRGSPDDIVRAALFFAVPCTVRHRADPCGRRR